MIPPPVADVRSASNTRDRQWTGSLSWWSSPSPRGPGQALLQRAARLRRRPRHSGQRRHAHRAADPPGSSCSIAIGTGIVGPSGSVEGPQLVVHDIDARTQLVERSVEVSPLQHYGGADRDDGRPLELLRPLGRPRRPRLGIQELNLSAPPSNGHAYEQGYVTLGGRRGGQAAVSAGPRSRVR